MSVKLQTLMQIIETIAPKSLAEEWDNVGLIIGSPSKEINRILITLDIDNNVVAEAINTSCDLIITHHPTIFKPLKAIREDLPSGKIITDLIRHDISVYAAHTNLDAATGGVNDVLAALLSLEDIKPLSADKEEHLNKLVVYVPNTHLAVVRSAMGTAGAGSIGKYAQCFFAAPGQGTFLPLGGATPFVGSVGKVEEVQEWRLETIVTQKLLKKVISAMIKAHPYEEVAYDVIVLANEGEKKGIGRIGRLPSKMTLLALAEKVKLVLDIQNLKIAGEGHAEVSKVAVVGGSGSSYINLAAFKGAQCLITGDVKYHEAQDALQRNICIIDAGHFETERPVLTSFSAKISKALEDIGAGVEIVVSASQSTPFTYM